MCSYAGVQYNLHQVTMMNNTTSRYYFWKLLQKHFRKS